MIFRNPERMQEAMAPALGEIRFRPSTGSRFKSKVDMFRLKQLCLFTVHANSIHVQMPPPHDFVAINIPLGRPFLAKVGTNYEQFSDYKAHCLSAEDEFELDCEANCSVLVCTFNFEGISPYARKILHSDDLPKSVRSSELCLFSPAGVFLQRSMAKAWSHLHSIEGLDNRCAISEIEDDLTSRFVLLIESRARESIKGRPVYLKNAEEYLCANLREDVTRDALCDALGVPLRTLSWAFQKYYGTGPMAFLNQRRLEAAYRDLLAAEPDAKSVSNVALTYRFAHLGKFSIEYKHAFGESPSVTLARSRRFYPPNIVRSITKAL